MTQPAGPDGSGQRVLVVDDNRDAADSLALLLGLLGAEARVAYDGAGALSAARAWRPSLVLLDLAMPGMDGFAVARHLRAEGLAADAQLVAVTGYGRHSDALRALEAGFDRHLVKPVELDALQALVAALRRPG